MNYRELLKKVSDHVKLFYLDHPDARLLYHDLLHAKEMADAAMKIADHYQCDEKSRFIVFTAAWFHDTGYLLTLPLLHEVKSAELAENFLRDNQVAQEDIEEVKACIMATKMPQQPSTLTQKIVCDADLFYLGTEIFPERNKLLRKETEALENIKISGTQWRAQCISFLEAHHFHTDFCQAHLNKTKAENLRKIKAKQNDKTGESESPVAAAVHQETSGGQEDVKPAPAAISPAVAVFNAGPTKNIQDPKKVTRPVRGFETVFRVSSSKNQRLSVMADNKAHIMISVNSIIISVALGLVVRKLDTEKQLHDLIIPTLLLLSVNVVTIIYSVLATRSRIPPGIFTQEQVEKKSVNLLFFGSFWKMNYNEYENGMKQMMNDSEFLHTNMIKDLFWEGKVLGRKYRLLRTSYNVFMYGISIAMGAYAVALFFIK